MKKLSIYNSVLFLSTISILFFTCNSEKEEAKQKDSIQVTLVPSDTIKIRLDNSISHELSQPQYFKDVNQNEFIIALNSSLNEIIVVDLNNKKVQKKIRIPENGPNSIGKISGYYYKSHDSIFVEKKRAGKIYLIDSTLKHYKIFDTKTSKFYGSFSTIIQPMQYQAGNLYLLSWNLIEDKKQFFVKSGMTQVLNINQDKMTLHSVGYPEIYRKDKYYGGSMSDGNLALGKSGISFASFNLDDNIYKYSENKLLLEKKLPSQKVSVSPIEIKPDDDSIFDKYTKILAKSASYHILRHDPYNSLLYRWVVYPSDEYKDPITGEINFGRNKPFSLQIIDEDLNHVGEVEFPKYTFDYFFGMVPTPHGLLFNMYHPLNEDVEEDVLKFVIFQVKKKEE